ncbi:MAG: hypothetical protein JXB49_07560 [Bacteroidales bacterium]|nr:hypothetical protein [Bacteroidales bacterium]
MNESEKQQIVSSLVAECQWYFNNVQQYYGKENEFKRRETQVVKPLGQKLYDAGGLRLMREVYALVENQCMQKFGKGCRSALDMRWNGVGEWMG